MNRKKRSAPLGSAEAVIEAWEAWDAAPSDKHRVLALSDARVAYVGLVYATEFHAHVAAKRREGCTVAEAVYSWDPR